MSFKTTLYNDKMKKILIAFYLIFVVTHVCAIDKYDEKTNQLTISSVLAGANTYNNVVANVGTVEVDPRVRTNSSVV